MNLLTKENKLFLLCRKLTPGCSVPAPSSPFEVYSSNCRSSREGSVDVNGLTKSLGSQRFRIISLDYDTGLARINFQNRPYHSDGYVEISVVENRGIIEMLLLGALTIPFMMMMNLWSQRLRITNEKN